MLPVVDIFAGPGGLGEGFTQAGFDILLSAEMDPVACDTLRVRKFFHQFRESCVPEEYYKYIRGEVGIDVLKKRFPKEWANATNAVANVELGTSHGNSVFNRMLDQKLESKDDFILIGGPPCQAYSIAGRSRMLGVGKKALNDESKEKKEISEQLANEFYKDKRHTLYYEYVKILCRYQPVVFVMENVKGMGSAKSALDERHGSTFNNICFGLRNPFDAVAVHTRTGGLPKGYKLYSLSNENKELFTQSEIQTAHECVLKSEKYGVPQARHRIIILGVREDLDFLPEKLTSSNISATVREAIANLPALRSGLSKEKDTTDAWKKAIVDQVTDNLIGHTDIDKKIETALRDLKIKSKKYERGAPFIRGNKGDFDCQDKKLQTLLNDPRIQGVIQHETRSHIRADLLRYFLVSILGAIDGKSPKFSEWKGKLSSIKPKHTNVTLNEQGLQSSSHKDRFKVQVWDKPSSTIVSHISKDGHYFIHPDPTQCRSFTAREVARLQTFPDNYFFCGNRTQQYHQVGNAVPILLAKKIGKLLMSI